MTQKLNGHSVAHAKRLARKIKKAASVTQTEALNQAAVSLGFSNWKHFFNQNQPISKAAGVLVTDKIKPYPIVLTYYSMAAKNGDKRPNAKMSIPKHQEIGSTLKALFHATEFHKQANNPVAHVRNVLDDWIQYEYTDRKELPDEVFSAIYYGDEPTNPEYKPGAERNQELISLARRAQCILKDEYHECRPVSLLVQKLDQTVLALGNWPPSVKKRLENVWGRQIPVGTFFRIKGDQNPMIVMRHDIFNGIIRYYGDKGADNISDRKVSIYRDQSRFKDFRPKLLILPFGKWTCANGTQVLFNLDYMPIWVRDLSGNVSSIDPDTWINYCDGPELFFDKSDSPLDGNTRSEAVALDVLRNWGVLGRNSNLLKLLGRALDSGQINLLIKKDPVKLFPVDVRKSLL